MLVVFGVALLFDGAFELFFAGDCDPLFRRRELDWLELISPWTSTGMRYCSIINSGSGKRFLPLPLVRPTSRGRLVWQSVGAASSKLETIARRSDWRGSSVATIDRSNLWTSDYGEIARSSAATLAAPSV